MGTRLLLALVLVLCAGLVYAATATLQWDQTTDATVTNANVYRGTDTACTSSTPLISLLTTLGVVNAYTDQNVPTNISTVCFEITWVNAGGESGHSNRASKTMTLPPPPPPPAPTNLRLSRWDGSQWLLLASA